MLGSHNLGVGDIRKGVACFMRFCSKSLAHRMPDSHAPASTFLAKQGTFDIAGLRILVGIVKVDFLLEHTACHMSVLIS